MALTLAEAKVGMADKVDQNVIDEFRRASLLLDMLHSMILYPLEPVALRLLMDI